MPVKIRLTRQGRTKSPFYHIVIADSRAPRDGKYIERIGYFNPCTNPATIELNFDRALDWLQKGAQPTDICRSLLSKQGVLIKKHFLEGVKKGAISADEAESKFQAWLKDKEAKLNADKDQITKKKAADAKNRLDAESRIREEKARILAEKQAELEKKKEESETRAEETAAAEPVASTKIKTPELEKVIPEAPIAEEKAEEKAADKTEAKAEEKAAEKTETKVETKAAEKTETKAEEQPEAAASVEKKEEIKESRAKEKIKPAVDKATKPADEQKAAESKQVKVKGKSEQEVKSKAPADKKKEDKKAKGHPKEKTGEQP